MLAIAGGVIIGGLGLLIILAIIGAIVENAEEVAQGCALIAFVVALIAAWAFLDDTWPEIDWIRTAFALAGGLFAAFLALAMVWDSQFARKLSNRETPRVLKEEETSPKNVLDTTITLSSAVQVEKIDDFIPQTEAETATQETDDEWRSRVARELRLSREPKWPTWSAKTRPDRAKEEFFSEYIKWKYDTKRDDPE